MSSYSDFKLPDALIIGDVVPPEIFWLTDLPLDPDTDFTTVRQITDMSSYGALVDIAGGAKINTGDGDDSIFVYDDGELTNNAIVSTGAGDDCVSTSSGDDAISSGSGDDTIDTGVGTDIVHAGSGDDWITFAGNAMVYGGSGDDWIESDGSGWSLMVGGTGDDMLYGGAGQDTFVFNTNSGEDFVDGFGIGDILEFHVGNNRVTQVTEYGLTSFTVLDSQDHVLSLVDVHLVGGATHIDEVNGVFIGV